MYKILYVFGAIENGGIEKLVSTILDNIDRDLIQIDIAYHSNEADKERVSKFYQMLSSRCNAMYSMPSFIVFNYVEYRKWWKNFLNEHGNEYNIVHLHYLDSAFCFIDLLKRNGIIKLFNVCRRNRSG